MACATTCGGRDHWLAAGLRGWGGIGNGRVEVRVLSIPALVVGRDHWLTEWEWKCGSAPVLNATCCCTHVGWNGLLRTALAIMELSSEELLAMDNLGLVLPYLQKLPFDKV